MCFRDPEAGASRKQKKTGKQSQNEEARPNRVVTMDRSGPPGVERPNSARTDAFTSYHHGSSSSTPT